MLLNVFKSLLWKKPIVLKGVESISALSFVAIL